MLNAYIINPKDLRLHISSNAPLNSPLSFSVPANRGMIADNGLIHIGSADELPVFVKYADGIVEILNKPTSDATAHSEFMVSGELVIVKDNTPIELPSGLKRPMDEIKRLVMGIMPNGSVCVFLIKASLNRTQKVLCAYGVEHALLIGNNDFYFNNPKNLLGYSDGESLVTLNASMYEEIKNPIIAFDALHGGAEMGVELNGVVGKEVLLSITKEIVDYLSKNYVGTFLLTRKNDTYVEREQRLAFSNDVFADFTIILGLTAHNDTGSSFEFSYDECIPTAYKDVIRQIWRSFFDRIENILPFTGILTEKSLIRLKRYKNPAFLIQMGNITNEREATMFKDEGIRKYLAHIFGEVFAEVFNLERSLVSGVEMERRNVKYTVDVGTFSFRLNAEELSEELRKKGYDATVRQELTINK